MSFPAFGGQAMVGVTDPDAMAAALRAVQETVAEFDHACSRFRDDSEISRVNRSAGRTVGVSSTLLEAIEVALEAARLTDGDVDPTIGGALVALGYDADFDSLPADRTVELVAVPGWHRVQIDSAAGTVRIPRGTQLDLGATAKALAADCACGAALAALDGGGGVLVSFSGDMASAGTPPAGGWRVRVTDDHRSDATAAGQWILLAGGGLATSSSTVRRWKTDRGIVHHLIDPRTGAPASGPWRTASVTAASCVEANIASTATLIRGRDAAGWLESLELPARLVDHEGHVRHLSGWPTEGDDLS